MTDTAPEFSRPVTLEELHGGSVRRTIEASQSECRRLAERFGISAVDALSATVTLDARDDGRFVVAKGAFTAAVTQTCVVTLEPLPRTVSEQFVVRLAGVPEPDENAVVDLDPTAEDEPEPIEGGSIDIGELVAQHLLLALDPYPRAEGVELDPRASAAGEAAPDGPFAKLARLKRNE